MTNDIVDALKDELSSHGATDFIVEMGGKHRKLYWNFNGQEMKATVPSTPSDRRAVLNAVGYVRRMIGVNQGSGPGERRIKTKAARSLHASLPPETLTVKSDPFEALLPLRDRLESEMEPEMETASMPVKPTKKAKPTFVMPVPTIREREWLAEMLKRGERERHIVLKRRVSPGLAAAMLELNLANRPITESQVILHEGRLRRNDFVLTHQGIAFSKTNVLNDGQHRLLAIARSGITGDLQITFGAEREEFKIVDGGRGRGAGDIIGVTNKNQPALRAAVSRIIVTAENKARVFDAQIVAEKALAMQSLPSTDVAVTLAWAMKKVCNPTPPAAAYCWIEERSPSKLRVNEFFEGLPSGEGLVGIKLKLREWLRDKTLHRHRSGHEGLWRTAGIILAWNAWLAGRKSVNMDWRGTVELPEPK